MRSFRLTIALTVMLLSLVAQGALESADVDALLKGHNTERSFTSLSALTWDSSLEASAGQWADSCPEDHSPDSTRKGAAENLGWGWPTMNASGVVNDWIVEKNDLVNGVCNTGKQCGHYQEIVNPNSRSLGCATKKSCPSTKVSGQNAMQVWVCHYGQAPGNGSTNGTSSTNGTNSTNVTSPAPTSAVNASSTALSNSTAIPPSTALSAANLAANPSSTPTATGSSANPSLTAQNQTANASPMAQNSTNSSSMAPRVSNPAAHPKPTLPIAGNSPFLPRGLGLRRVIPIVRYDAPPSEDECSG